jgi:formylglycine-generating enzyme
MTTGAVRALPKDMVRVPPGSFVMGSEDYYPEERPAHEESLDGFAMDEHPVTNAEFRRFVKATGYLTIAERAPDPADFPDADPADLVPGSLVFRPTEGPVPLDDWRRWWHWTPGAAWRSPEGSDSSTLHGRDRHPVVHVAFEDAMAYAEWAGKELPTEIEWEYAARAGRTSTSYAWGEQFMPKGKPMANTWHGRFPWENLDPAGIERTSPVGRYPPNDWGLVDLIGNVWEWTTSPWTDNHADHAVTHSHQHACCGVSVATLTENDRRVMKGGSHLCAPSYCLRYRPPARQGQHVRSSTSHLGFRCIVRG